MEMKSAGKKCSLCGCMDFRIFFLGMVATATIHPHKSYLSQIKKKLEEEKKLFCKIYQEIFLNFFIKRMKR